METKTEINKNVDYLKSMIKSCYAYNDYKKGGLSYKRYIEPYRVKLGDELFELTYNTYVKHLEETYEVSTCTYTDCEGLTYNSLVEKA